jgi:hypothetical protein
VFVFRFATYLSPWDEDEESGAEHADPIPMYLFEPWGEAEPSAMSLSSCLCV